MDYNLKHNIKALREREAIQHAMIENLSDVIAILDKEGVITYKSPNIEKWFGWKPEDLLNHQAFENVHPDDQSGIEYIFVDLLKNPESAVTEECRYKCKDQTYKWIEMTAVNLLSDPIVKGILINYHDITKRKLSELELQQNREAYKRLLNNVDEIIYSISFDSDYIHNKVDFVSDQIRHIIGYAPDEFTNNPDLWLSIIHPDDMEHLEKRRFVPGIYRIKHKLTGEYIWIEDHPQSIFDSTGKIIGQFGTAHDITHKILFQKKLEESQKRLNRAELASKAGNWEYHLDTNTMIASEGATKVYGVKNEIDDFEHLRSIPLPEYRPMLNLAMKNLIEKNKPYNVEFKIKAVDTGKIKDIHSVASFDSENRILFGIIQDITERKQTEEALRVSEERFRTIFDIEPDCVKIINPDYTVVTMNSAGLNMIEVDSLEQVKGKSILEQIDIEFREDFIAMTDNVCKNGVSGVLTFRITGEKGTSRWLTTHSVPLRNSNNEITGLLGVTRDITEQRKAEESLQQLNLAIRQSHEIIFITDTEGIITFINPEFTETYGYSAIEVVGKATPRILKSNFLSREAIEMTWKKILNKECIKAEYVNRCKDGNLIDIEGSIDPILDEKGEIVGFLGIHRNITNRKRAEAELVAAKEIAEQSNHLKSALLNNLSHEIRTPMNAIMGFSDLMKEADADEKDRYTEIISNSSNQLLSLIDDVILLSRLQSEKMPLDKCEFKPAELVSEIRMVFDHPIMNKGLAFRENCPKHLKYLRVLGDVKKIRQVIINFVSNSLKYTSEGFIEIGFELKEGSLEFFVKDSGMGIPEHEKELIFEAFYRSEQALSAAIRGTGLGLNIAKELIGLMGGNIGVRSEVGKGSIFYFTIPFEKFDQLEYEEPPKITFSKGMANFEVLIVDDEHFNIQYLDILLRDKVKKIDHAINGKEAVEMALKNNYNLVLMDLKMPIMDGIQATRILKEKLPDLLIIAQTACALPEEKESALQAGCDDFIVKPINKEKMMKVINKYC